MRRINGVPVIFNDERLPENPSGLHPDIGQQVPGLEYDLSRQGEYVEGVDNITELPATDPRVKLMTSGLGGE